MKLNWRKWKLEQLEQKVVAVFVLITLLAALLNFLFLAPDKVPDRNLFSKKEVAAAKSVVEETEITGQTKYFLENYFFLDPRVGYLVKEGDNVWDLTKQYTTLSPVAWRSWINVGSNGEIQPNQLILIPLNHLKKNTPVRVRFEKFDWWENKKNKKVVGLWIAK